MFYSSSGDFQWASIAAIISLFAALITIWGTIKNNRIQKEINAKNIEANLKAKARIEWIQKTRIISAELITNSFKFDTLSKEYLNLTERINSYRNEKKAVKKSRFFYFKSKVEKEDEFVYESIVTKRSNTFHELQETFDLIYEKQVLFKLYFGPNFENDKIVRQSLIVRQSAEIILESITDYRLNLDKQKGIEMYEELKDFGYGKGDLNRSGSKILNFMDISKINNTSLKKEIELFSDASRKYFKKEWDIAKKGE